MSRFLRTETHAIDLAAVEVVRSSMHGLRADVAFIMGNGIEYELAVTPADGAENDEQRVASITGRVDQIMRDWMAAREGKR